jgi:hypothetical protein
MVASDGAYQTVLAFLDGVFADGLPFSADSITAAAFFSALKQRYPGYFTRASKTNLEEI